MIAPCYETKSLPGGPICPTIAWGQTAPCNGPQLLWDRLDPARRCGDQCRQAQRQLPRRKHVLGTLPGRLVPAVPAWNKPVSFTQTIKSHCRASRRSAF